MSVLTFVREVNITAQPAITTSEDYFKEAGIGWMGGNFKAQLLGLEVAAIGETDLLTLWELKVASVDDAIIAELGDKAEVSVSQFTAFLAANRENPRWFIAYILGRNGNPWAVLAHGLDQLRFWRVEAYSVDSPIEWNAGHHVISR